MSREVEDLQRQIELHLNTISADQQVFGITLQVLILNMVQNSRAGDQLFHDLRNQVLASIDSTEPSRHDPQGAERHKQLTRLRAEQFFQVIGAAAGVEPDKTDPSAVS